MFNLIKVPYDYIVQPFGKIKMDLSSQRVIRIAAG